MSVYNICFALFFLLFYVTGVEKSSIFFFQIMILEHFHFCLANHACVSHLLRGQPHLLECYYWNCLLRTNMCVHPISEWSGFFTLQCELFTSYGVSNNTSLVYARTGGGVGGGRLSTKCGQTWRGGGRIPKISNLCVWITPNRL